MTYHYRNMSRLQSILIWFTNCMQHLSCKQMQYNTVQKSAHYLLRIIKVKPTFYLSSIYESKLHISFKLINQFYSSGVWLDKATFLHKIYYFFWSTIQCDITEPKCILIYAGRLKWSRCNVRVKASNFNSGVFLSSSSHSSKIEVCLAPHMNGCNALLWHNFWVSLSFIIYFIAAK